MTMVTMKLKIGEWKSIPVTNVTSTLPQMTNETTLKKGKRGCKCIEGMKYLKK